MLLKSKAMTACDIRIRGEFLLFDPKSYVFFNIDNILLILTNYEPVK